LDDATVASDSVTAFEKMLEKLGY